MIKRNDCGLKYGSIHTDNISSWSVSVEESFLLEGQTLNIKNLWCNNNDSIKLISIQSIFIYVQT
jgi:hypothetical protein